MRCPIQGMGFETRWTSLVSEPRSGNGAGHAVDWPGTGHAVGDWLHQTLTDPMERVDPMERAALLWARLHSVIFCCHRWSLFADHDVSHLAASLHVLLTRVNA